MEAKAKAGEEDLSMEEILQSIRKIIAEDGDEVPAVSTGAATSDVLELTEIIEEPPAAAEPVQAAAPSKPAVNNDILSKIDQAVVPEPVVAAPAANFSAPSSPMATNSQAYIDSLLSSESASATAAAFKKIQPAEQPIVTTPSAQFRSGICVEDLVMESLKPMLKQWLDMNLPNIVERIVEREIKKLVD